MQKPSSAGVSVRLCCALHGPLLALRPDGAVPRTRTRRRHGKTTLTVCIHAGKDSPVVAADAGYIRHFLEPRLPVKTQGSTEPTEQRH